MNYILSQVRLLGFSQSVLFILDCFLYNVTRGLATWFPVCFIYSWMHFGGMRSRTPLMLA